MTRILPGMARVSLPPGWYPDPDVGGDMRMRWFDGNDWTDHLAAKTPEQQMLEVAEREAESWRKVRRVIWWPLIGGAALFVALALVALVSVLR